MLGLGFCIRVHKGDDSAEPQHSPANRTPALAFSPRNMVARGSVLFLPSLWLWVVFLTISTSVANEGWERGAGNVQDNPEYQEDL